MTICGYVKITPDNVLSGNIVPDYSGTGNELLTSVFRNMGSRYMKFFKMDTLCRLGYIASEILLSGEAGRFEPRENRAVILMNSSASLCDDRHYQETIMDNEAYYPSPAVFVYTLPNIVTGEICIRNKYYGESSFYIMEGPDPVQMYGIITDAFQDRRTTSVLGGWLECSTDDVFEADLFLVDREDHPGKMKWNIENINSIIEL